MASNWSKNLLSASANGKNIAISATSSPGTLIHVAPAGTTTLDEVWLVAVNNGSADVLLFLEWGGTDSSDLIKVPVLAAKGDQQIVAGRVLQNGLSVNAYSPGGAISIGGFVNRVMES